MYFLKQIRFVAVVVLLSVLAVLMFLGSSPVLFPSSSSKTASKINVFIQETGTSNINCILPKVEARQQIFRQKKPPINCQSFRGTQRDLISVVDGNFLKIDLKFGEFTCYYIEITRGDDDFTVKVSNETEQFFDTDKKMNNIVPCPAEMFQAVCYDKTTPEIRPPIFDLILRCLPPVAALKKVEKTDERLNILIFGLDSMSRVAWLEQLPETSRFVSEQLDGITLEGYNIVGDGTTAALLGLLTGYMEEELHEARRGFKGAKEIDDFPFIWRQLRNEAGYVTLWDEDQPDLGTFQYRLLGFKQPPVDYYGRKYHVALKTKPDDRCLGAISDFEETLRLFRQFFAVYPDPTLKFAFVFNAEYTHTSADGGNQEAYRFDRIMADELRWLQKNGHLNKTALILMSDHGSRFGESRATYRGKITERLPYLTVILPPWFRRKYSDQIANLRIASRQLTTPFDLHATLLDFAGGLEKVPGTPERGRSLLRTLPAHGRTCEEAGVLPHWCTCLQGDEIDPDSKPVQLALEKFQHYVNRKMLGHLITSGQCQPIKVEKPAIFATMLKLRREVAKFLRTIDGHGRTPYFTDDVNTENQQGDYNLQVSFTTQPGDGKWEVTFGWQPATNDVTILPKQISRINRYGSAPRCIQDTYPHLRQFCVCNNN